MKQHATALLALATLCAATTATTAVAQRPADPTALVRRGLDAIGGADAVRNLPGYRAESYFLTWTLGQSELPDSPPRATMSVSQTVMDWRSHRRFVTTETRPVTGGVNRTRNVIANGIGAQGGDALAAPQPANAIVATNRALRLLPDRLLLTALDQPTTLSALPAREFRGQMLDGVRVAGQDTISLWFDRISGLLVVTETITDDNILGDRSLLTYYTRWQDIGMGVKLPRQNDAIVNGTLAQHTIFTAVEAVAPPDSLFAIPDSIAARAQRTLGSPPPVVVNLVQLAPNVWRAEGTNHHTLVVDQGASLVLVEAPTSTVRVRAILDTLRGRFPNKPISALVNTHHHWDHSGGLREIIAEGIPIITHESNAAFVRRVGAAARTVSPDAQQQRRRQVTVRPVTDSLVIGSGAGTVIAYHTASMHAQGIISAWVPSARVLFASDVLNPAPTSVAPLGSAELVTLARSRGLSPASYAGGHGRVVPWEEIARAAAPSP